MKPYASGLVWGEGPRFHDGALWVSDTQGKRLWTDADGTWRSHDLSSPSNGLWFLPDGTLVGVMMAQSRIGRWTGTEFATYADLAGIATGGLGDVVGDRHGNLYVGDLGPMDPSDPGAADAGQLILVRPDGTAAVAARDMAFPNGMALIDSGTTLVVAESFRQRLIAFDVDEAGELSNRRPYADIAALAGPSANPDGIWGVGDDVWVATLDAKTVLRLRGGEVVEQRQTPGPPIACCSDGDQRLFVTVADTGGRPVFEAMAQRAVSARVWVDAY